MIRLLVKVSSGKAQLYIFEDNEAVIKMCIKGRSPTMRHVSRTHRVDLDWLTERIKLDPGIMLKFVGTGEQMADLLTKSSFTTSKWQSLLSLHQIGTRGESVPKGSPKGESAPIKEKKTLKDQKERKAHQDHNKPNCIQSSAFAAISAHTYCARDCKLKEQW